MIIWIRWVLNMFLIDRSVRIFYVRMSTTNDRMATTNMDSIISKKKSKRYDARRKKTQYFCIHETKQKKRWNNHPFRHICWPFDLKGNTRRFSLSSTNSVAWKFCSIVELLLYVYVQFMLWYKSHSKDKKENTINTQTSSDIGTDARGTEKECAHRAYRDAVRRKKSKHEKKERKKECVYKKWIETREKNRYETRPRRPFMPYVNNVCSPNSSSKSILFYVYAQTTLFQPNESFSPVSDFSCL